MPAARLEERDARLPDPRGFMEPMKDYETAGKPSSPAGSATGSPRGLSARSSAGCSTTPQRCSPRRSSSPKTGPRAFADGVKNITEAQQRVAAEYLEDGSINDACPPLAGAADHHGARLIRGQRRPPRRHPHMFTREYLAGQRLVPPALGQAASRHRHVETAPGIHRSFPDPGRAPPGQRWELPSAAPGRRRLRHVSSPHYVQSLVGSLGTDERRGGIYLIACGAYCRGFRMSS